jgi:LPS sulfotransferase NodH
MGSPDRQGASAPAVPLIGDAVSVCARALGVDRPVSRDAPLARQSTPVRFVILAAPRTGSNMLCSMLNSHPQVLCHHELFNPAGIHYALDHRAGESDLGSPAERDRDPEGFLARLWQQPGGASALGFKLNRDQNDTAFNAVLADPDIRKVVLIRRNRIQTFVSEAIAQETGRWESYAFSDLRPYPGKIYVDVRQLREHAARNQAYHAALHERLAATGQQCLDVAYEDLAEPAEQARILQYLGVAPGMTALRPATVKINARDLRDVVANYATLAAQLSGSDLEADLRLGRDRPAAARGPLTGRET